MPLRTRSALELRRALRQGSLLLAFAVAFAVGAAPAAAPAGISALPRGEADIDPGQCENLQNQVSINDCSGNAWVTGSLSAPHAAYRAGDFVPMRVIITDLAAGTTYTLRLDYRAVDHGLHAYDYLGSVDASRHPGQQIIPCSGVGDTAGVHSCTSQLGPSIRDVPKDTPNEPQGNPGTTFPPGGSQRNGHFSAWGGTLTGLAYFNCGTACRSIGPGPPGANADIERQIDVRFHTAANGHTVVLAWGAHIASPLDWGLGRTTAGARSGSDLRVYFIHIQREGGSPETTGGKTLTLKPADIAPPPGLTTQVSPTSVTTDQTVRDTATLTPVGSNPVRGDVHFFVCFNATMPPDCRQNGTRLGPPKVVNANPPPSGAGGTASVDFSADQQVGGHGPGYYCFRVEFRPGTPHYSPTLHTNTSTSGTGAECFVATLPPPLLTVTKECDPATDPGLFNLLVDGAAFGLATNVPCGHVEGPHEVAVGPRTVSETAGTGTSLANYTTTIGGNCTPIPANPTTTGSVALALGDEAVCTITNARNPLVPAMLTVHKVCVPPTDPGRFEILVDDRPVGVLNCGDSTVPVGLAPGTYTVREAGGEDTSLADYTTVISGDCNPQTGSITLTAGQAASCTFTNTRIPPATTLRVDKACDPPGDNGRFEITIATVNAIVERKTVDCGGTTGAVNVDPGIYTVSETGANGTDLSHYDRVVGGDCESDGTVLVLPGQHAVCLITNVRKGTPSAQLSVTKICVPADDGGRFNLTIDGQTSRDVACGHGFGPVVVSPGQHHISESAGTGTSLSDYTTSIGGSCAPDGTVTLTNGQHATCTITNVRAGEATGTVEIEKQCSPAGQTASFQLELDHQVFRGIACGQSTGPVVIGVGDHRVGEVSVGDITSRFTTSIGGACSASGSFTLSPGQHVTCVVTNTLVPVKPPPKPPLVCYTLHVARRMVTVGNRVVVLARVHVHGRPIHGVRVYAVGPGVSAVRTTGRTGHALFVFRLRRPGILRFTIRKPYLCPPLFPRKIGVLAARTRALSG